MSHAENAESNRPPGSSESSRKVNCHRTALLVIVAMTMVTLLSSLAIQRLADRQEEYLDADGWGSMGFKLAEGRGLVDGRGQVSAFRGPVVPVVYAAASLLCGSSYDVLLVTQCLFFALANGLLGTLCQRWSGDWRITLVSMTMYLGFVPAYPWFCHVFTEPIFTTVLAAFMLSWMITLERSPAMSVFTGLLWAVTALCRPLMFYFLPVIVLVEVWKRGFTRAAFLSIAALIVGFLTLEIPWVVRNTLTLGKPVATTTGSSAAIYLMTWHQQANWTGNVFHDPSRFPPAAEGFWQLPQEQRDQRFREMAKDNFREAPGQVLLLIPKRAMMFLFQLPSRGWLPTPKSILLGGLIYASALLGLRRMTPQRRRAFVPVFALLAFQLLFHSLLVSEYRYSHPVQPYVFMLSAFGLVSLTAGVARRLFGIEQHAPV